MHNIWKSPVYLVIHDTAVSRKKYSAMAGSGQLKIVDAFHERKGYDRSAYGHNAAYHYFIEDDGTVIHTRPDTDRTLHTSNCDMALESISIVLAGSFDTDYPSRKQALAFVRLVTALQEKYHIANDKIIGHGEASGTSCPGKHIMDILLHYRKLHEN